MADDVDFSTSAEPSLQQLATFLADELFDVNRIGRLETVIANAATKAGTVTKGAETQVAVFLAELLGKFLSEIEQFIEPAVGPALAKLAGHLVGIDIPASALRQSATAGGDTPIGNAVTELAFRLFAAPEGEIQPGDDGARRMVATLAQLVFNGWFEATAFEMITTLFPNMDSFESVAELPHELVNTLGLGRLGRVAFRPLAQNLIATPLDWQLKKKHRPNLLSEGEIIKAFQRGDYTNAEAIEELSRLGYSDKRQDMLLASAFRNISLDDALELERGRTIDRGLTLAKLKAQGYDATEAEYLIIAAENKRRHSIEDNFLPTLVHAFVNRDLTEAEFRTLFPPNLYTDDERELFITGTKIQERHNVRHMSQGEVLDALDHLILPLAFYRDWLRREGYPDEEATALELLYIAKRNEKADINAERKRIAKEKADEQAARDAAKQQRQTELEAERALRRRGSLSDLRRAYARGLITRDRLAEVLNAELDADTVATLLEDADVDRANEAAREQAAADAKQRAARKQIDVGALEQAVLHHILTVQAYADALTARGFDGGDVSILAATLAARLKDQDDAVRQRAQAAQAAAVKHIDLVRFEHLVRRGLRTVGDYDTLLRTLGFEDAARAAMEQLLSVQIADDAKAQQLRDASAAKAGVKELSLEQFRRAVILELKSETDYGNFVAKQGYTPDAAAVLVAELQRDVADADAARAKRLAAEASAGVVDLPLSRATAAARLGVITPDAYAVRLKRAGYSDDDIAIEMELLLVEIADTQAARATRDRLAAAIGPARALSLAQLAQSVKVGTATIDQYRAAAAALYAPDDVDTLAATLEAETQTHADARARHDAIDTELSSRALSLGELEGQVKAGTLSIAAYKAQLAAWGYEKDDAQLLATLLV